MTVARPNTQFAHVWLRMRGLADYTRMSSTHASCKAARHLPEGALPYKRNKETTNGILGGHPVYTPNPPISWQRRCSKARWIWTLRPGNWSLASLPDAVPQTTKAPAALLRKRAANYRALHMLSVSRAMGVSQSRGISKNGFPLDLPLN